MEQWTNSCRACLGRAECFSHFIYEHISPEQYFYCTSIEVKYEDGLPKALCDHCYIFINEFIEFKSKCIQSENNLHTLLLKEELSLKLERKDPSEDVAATQNMSGQELIALETAYNVKIEIEDVKEEADEILNDSHNDDAPKDIENHVEATSASSVKLIKSPKRRIKAKDSMDYNCERCNRKFSSAKRLENHIIICPHKEGKGEFIECNICHKTYKGAFRLRCHIKSCHTDYTLKDVTCPICFKVFSSPHTLSSHKRTHEQKWQRVCEECGKVFKNTATYKHHLDTHVKNRERNYPCEYCGKKFINKKVCGSHILIRHRNRQYICDYCGYVFSEKAYLKQHIMRHEGRNPLYQCDVCLQSLTSKPSLKAHKRMHTGEKPYSCKYCSKAFAGKLGLEEHERNHTGEKPFECVLCGMKFSRRNSMRRHMKVHKIVTVKQKNLNR
ncbi:zinc finger protein 260-like [Cydia fagiglandana]|uniref:zinc finger protein 260-like n=1 Tax=Cydia fagiglandana TaxID=1458189 RepID=UPI002FEDF5C4